MPVTLIHMRGDGTGGAENAAANIDIPEDGMITGVEWSAAPALNADGEEFAAELSFIATGQFSTNDSRGQISVVRARLGLLTSGASATGLDRFTPMDLAVSGGERIYLHLTATAGVVSSVELIIHFEPGSTRTRRSARRR